MRKFSKVVLVMAAAVGVVGIGLTIGGVSMGATIAGLNLTKAGTGKVIQRVTQYTALGDEEWEEDWDEIDSLEECTDADKLPVSDIPGDSGNNDDMSVYQADDVRKLEFKISSGELSLREYDGNQIKVGVSGKDKDKVRVGQDGETLVLEGIGRGQERTVIVWYPKKTRFTDISIEQAAGTVSFESDLATVRLEVSVAAGELTNAGKIRSGEAEIEVGTGNVDLNHFQAKRIEADCGIGNIDLSVKGKEADYNYEISCGAGSVDIGDSSYSGLGHEKKVSNPGASGKMSLDCGVGNITVDFE